MYLKKTKFLASLISVHISVPSCVRCEDLRKISFVLPCLFFVLFCCLSRLSLAPHTRFFVLALRTTELFKRLERVLIDPRFPGFGNDFWKIMFNCFHVCLAKLPRLVQALFEFFMAAMFCALPDIKQR